mgnify:CR=1 FL=1
MHDESWKNLEEALETEALIKGYISGKVRGGMTVDVAGVRAFLPGSLVDSRPLDSFDHLEKTFQDFKCMKLISVIRSFSVLIYHDVQNYLESILMPLTELC